MKFYRNFSLIYLFLFLYNGNNIVESKPITTNGNLNIHSRGDSTVYRPFKPKPPKPPDRDKSIPNEQVSTIHLVRVNINTKHNTDEFNYSYNISNRTHSYTATDGYLFKLVKDGKKTLWRSKQGKFADKITVKVKDGGDRSIRVFVPIDEETSDSESEDEGDKRPSNSNSLPKTHFDPVIRDSRRETAYDWSIRDFKPKDKSEHSTKLVVVDIKNKFNTNKIYYERNDLDNIHTFIPREPYLIGKVKRGETVLWEYSEGRFAEELILRYDKLGNPVLRINFAEYYPETDHGYDFNRLKTLPTGIEHDLSLTPLPCKPVTPKGPHVDVSTAQVAAPQSTTPDVLSFKERESEAEFQVDDTKYEEPELTPAIIDINKKESNKYTIYEYDSKTRTHTFTPTESHFIYIVKKGEQQLWESKPGIYPEKVLIMKDQFNNPVLRLQFPEPEPRKPIFVTLDVRNKFSTTESTYEYDPSKQIHTFIPNPGFIVVKVVKGKHQMWEYEHGFYPEKVLIMKDQFNNPVLRVQFPEPEPIPEVVPKIKVVSREPSEVEEEPAILTKTPIELDLGLEGSTQFFEYSNKMNVGTFTPRSDYLFSSVKESGRNASQGSEITIWQASYPGEYVKKVEFNYDNHLVTLYLSNGKTKKFKKVGTLWLDYTHFKSFRKTPISLDIECKHSTYFFDYSREGDTEVYKPKPDYIFKQVKRVPVPSILGLDAIIWKTDDPNMFSKKVEVTNDNLVTVYSVDGLARVYKKSLNNGWDLETEHFYSDQHEE